MNRFYRNGRSDQGTVDAAKWRGIYFGKPRIQVVLADSFNHFIHYRGQLSVYLRLNAIPLPGVYGPTADEQTM